MERKLNPELAIKIDFNEHRQNPEQIFEAMGLYINAYRDFGQVLANSIGLDIDFQFQLNAVEEGSILSRLSEISGRINEAFEAVFYDSGKELADTLLDVKETETEEEVEDLAANLESSLVEKLSNLLADPHIDRQQLAYVLSTMSAANQKLLPDEEVSLYSNKKDNKSTVNIGWRFTGNPKEMFTGKTEHHEIKDNLTVKISVNEGNSVWSFKSSKLETGFKARIANKEWLESYQNGLTRPIGPKDVLEADISYDIYTPPKGKGKPEIRNAKIIKIFKIHRNNEHQYELTTH